MIDFRYNYNGIDEINTFDNQLTRNYANGQKKVKFELTADERKAIAKYADSIKLDQIQIPKYDLTCGGKDVINISFPSLTHKLEFSINNRTKRKLNWGNNDCDDPTIKSLQDFADSLRRMILRKKELRDLKQTDILTL